MSTVAKKIMMGSGAAGDSAYEIEQSLIFNGGNSYLSKTFGSAGNRDRWTFSCWIKRSKLSVSAGTAIFAAYDNASNRDVLRFDATDEIELQVVSGGTGYSKKSVAKYRDPSAWYHIVAVYDSANATADYRIRLYVNGSEITSSTGTDPSSGLDSTINNSDIHYVGARSSSGSAQAFWGGYIAELNFIDGSALTPSSFGETNSATGQWIPKEYSGSYGNNGFYLKFASGAIGTDSSGNSNTYSATNLANHDVVIDSPTNNFATLNSAAGVSSAVVFSQGNLNGGFRGEGVAKAQQGVSTIAMPAGSGKWYWEMRHTYTGQGFGLGISLRSETPTLNYAGYGGYGYYNATGTKNDNATSSSYGTAWYTSGQTYILSCYYDSDNGKIGFKLNGTDQGFAFTNVRADSYVAAFADLSGGTGSASANINFGQNGTFGGAVTAQGNADGNGIGDFYYAPPSGYLALCTANLPDPAIALPSAQFNTVLYTGNDADGRTISGVGFQPDFVWQKSRNATNSNWLFNAVRGATKFLSSNETASEYTQADSLSAFTSDGFTISDNTSGADMNSSSHTYVTWNWKANGAGSTDTSGDVDCVLSANPTAGFSVLSFTGNGSNNDTIPHGLGVVPDFVWYKAGDSSWENFIHSSILSGNKRLLLQSTAAASSINTNYLIGGQIATSSMISNNGLTSSQAVVAWCFVSKPGFSKISTYTGNGNADGPFISTGFKPAWVMIKRTDATNNWIMFDNKRDVDNVATQYLLANEAQAEAALNPAVDFLSNGFKIRNTGNAMNANNGVYLYLAFAESPFKSSTAR